MGWNWRLERLDGSTVTHAGATGHANQSDAESWVGEHWRELADAGVAAVVLRQDGVEADEYRMSLSADPA